MQKTNLQWLTDYVIALFFLLAIMMDLLENNSSDKTSIGCSYKWKNQ